MNSLIVDIDNNLIEQRLDEASMIKDYKENPVKILQTIRLAAEFNLFVGYELHFTLHKVRNYLKKKDYFSDKERTELIKGICCGNGYRFIMLLDEYELLPHYFVNLSKTKEIWGAHYHNETVFTHCVSALRALDKLNLPNYVKMAALLHDIGKSIFEVTDDGKTRFTNHDNNGRLFTIWDLNRLGFEFEFIEKVAALVGLHMHMIGGKKSLIKLVEKLNMADIPFKYFVWVKYADSKSNMKSKTDFAFFRRMYRDGLEVLNPKHVPSVTDLVINGKDVMELLNVPQGKLIGVILNKLFQEYMEGELENTREALLTRGGKIRDENNR